MAKKIFVVDDDTTYQLILKHSIRKTDAEIVIEPCGNGSIATEKLKTLVEGNETLPDVILLDINMPVMDGWQFLDNFSLLAPELGDRVAVYMISSSLDIRDKDRALSNKNVRDYMCKPLSLEQLRSIMS